MSQHRAGPGDGSDRTGDGSVRTRGWLRQTGPRMSRTDRKGAGGCPGLQEAGSPVPCPGGGRAPGSHRYQLTLPWTLYFKGLAVTMAHSNNSAAASPGERHRMLSRHGISFLLSSALTADISHKCLLYYLPVIVFCAGSGPRSAVPVPGEPCAARRARVCVWRSGRPRIHLSILGRL